MLNMIVCMTKEGIIGAGDKLPWHYPEELKHFQETTMGSIVVMGRKTFESLPIKPLPGRINMVLTNDKNWYYPGVIRTTFKNVLKLKKKNISVFIIGGSEIYKLFYKATDRIFLSLINKEYDGDTKFPFSIGDMDKNFQVLNDKYLNPDIQTFEIINKNISVHAIKNLKKEEIKIL